MNNEFHIDSINDTLKFNPEQFARFLMDFAAWHSFMRMAQEVGAESRGMIWIDDGRMAVIDSVNLEVKETGEQIHIDLRPGHD